MDTHTFTITSFSADDIAMHIDELGALLHACVHDGASIGFVLPFSAEDGAAFWRQKVLPAARGGGLLMLVARQQGRIAGTVQLDYNTPPNQPHRAEVRKMMVHPDWRRQGIAQALMAELEINAAALGRSLLTLDTRTGDAAEPLYAALGYQTAGVIPGYCRDPTTARLDATTLMYKSLNQGCKP
ncbi:GNAT family N-acetyltransferase [Janthinobacterium sp.]|uniref:GNAT family N-acetyltransferase n=1 Tax=Janthinobacterium sp. TaxID=1871054 RepID=UPI00293D920C|nr:GNAT family N-acetyltransferase [Janthinobacterium sp.]